MVRWSPAVEEAEAEEAHHHDGAHQVEQDNAAVVLVRSEEFVFHAAVDDDEPGDQAHEEQPLPEPAGFQVLPALVAEPEPGVLGKITLGPERRPGEAAHGYQHHGGEEDVDEEALPLRLFPAYYRRQVDGGAYPGSGYPEDGQLQMPALGPAIGYQRRYKVGEEGSGAYGVMRQQAAHAGLQDEQGRHYHEELGRPDLAQSERQVHHQAAGLHGFLLAVKDPVAVNGVDDYAEDYEESEDARHAPEEGVGHHGVADGDVGRPVIGVGGVLPRP